MDDAQVGAWLRESLALRDITQKQLEDRFYGQPGPLRTLRQSSYSQICNGKQSLTTPAMVALALYLDVPPPFAVHTVPVVGYVGAGAEVHAVDDHLLGGGLEYVEVDFPVRRGTVAVIIRGDSMLPVFEDGDLVGYMEDSADPETLVGKFCIVRLTDGRTLIKKLKRGSERGLFTLVSANASDIEDVEIEWARRYRFHIPAGEWRSMIDM